MTGLRLEQKWYTTYLLFPLLFHLESHFLFLTLWLTMNTNLTQHFEGATHYKSQFSLHVLTKG